jgi:hypothetical protein
MHTLKNPAMGIALYAAVAVALLGGIGVTLAAIVNTAITSEPSVRAKLPLDARIESAREVRMALAKPVPRAQPLPPITAKVNSPAPKVVAARQVPKPNQQVAMQRARQAFARLAPLSQSQRRLWACCHSGGKGTAQFRFSRSF